MARTKRCGCRKIPTPTSFGSAPPLSASEFGAFRHGFFYSVPAISTPAEIFGIFPYYTRFPAPEKHTRKKTILSTQSDEKAGSGPSGIA